MKLSFWSKGKEVYFQRIVLKNAMEMKQKSVDQMGMNMMNVL